VLSGVEHVERFQINLLYLVYGDAPEPQSLEGQQFTTNDLDIGSDEAI
jgi:hypothetical protein